MTGLLKRRRVPTRGSLYFLFFILAGTAATTLPVTAGENNVAIDAIINHPAVAVARARVCQLASQYDVAVARERPQVDFSLRGGTSLKSRFEQRDANSPHSRRFDDVLGGKRTVMNYILSPIERAQSIAFREK